MIKNSLKSRQICLFFIAFAPAIKFFMLPSVTASVADRDEWLCCIANILLDFITLAILIKACRNSRTDFFGLCEKNLGKTGARVVYLLFAAYLVIKAYVPISEQRDYVELTLYTTLPSVLNFTPFMLLTFYLAQKKLRIVGRLADIVWFLAVTGYLLMFAVSIPNVSPEMLLPIGKTPSSKLIKGCFYSLNWFGDCVYYLFFIGRYEHKKGDTAKILCSYLSAAFTVLLFVTIFYGTFSSIAFRQRYALTEMSKYSTVINNVGRFDYLAIFSLLLAAAFSAAFPLYFANSLITKAIPFKNKKLITVIFFAIYTAFLIGAKEYNASIESFAREYGGYLFLFFGNIFPLLIAFFSVKEGKKIEIR